MDALCQSFGNRRLSRPRLSNQNRIALMSQNIKVIKKIKKGQKPRFETDPAIFGTHFGAAGQYLQTSTNFVFSSNDRIEFIFGRQGRQIDRVLLEMMSR
jgi:hypothetical protein